MPFVQRVIGPKFLSKTSLWTEDGKPKIEDHELEAVTNNTLSNALRQLASLLLVAEDIFCVLGDELKEINRRSETLKARIAKVDRKVADFDPKKVSVRLILCIIEGSRTVWTSPILKKLNNTDDNPLHRVISTDESSLLASLPNFGSIFASCLLMTISSKLGRKPLLALHGMVSLVSYLTLAFSANIWCYYVARFLSGLTAAAISVILPLYICELADSSSRGSLSAGMIVSLNVGILLAFMGGPFIPFIWYHSLMALMSIGFIISFSFFALESPYYFPKGDSSRIEVLLRKLRGVNDVTDDVKEIKRCLEENSEENFFQQIQLKGPRKAFLLGVVLVSLSTASGASVVITYAQVIFDSAGGNWSGEVCNIIVGVVQLVVSVIAAIVMDKFQRKLLIIASASMQALFIALLSLYLILKDKRVDVEAFGWAPLLCFLGYVSFYNIGVGPLHKTVVGEILPQGIKNTAMSFCSLWNGGIEFMLTFTFQRIEQSIGLGETLMFFSIMSLSTAVYVAIFIVETKGKTLAEIQLELNGLVLCIIEGTAIVWSSPILKKLNNTDDNPLHRVISTDESSLLASLPVFGSIFASCLLMTISSKLGRKPLLALHGMVSLVSYLTLAFSANIWCYYVARFISGLTAAAITVILPLYICELADSSSRGSLSAGMIVSVNGGILLAFMGGPFIPFIWYHSLMALMSIGFIISFSFFALESPYYFPKGDSSRIEVLLRKLRGVDDVTDEVNAIKRCLKETSEENFFEQIKLKGSRKAFMLGVGIVTLSTASGANVVITYAQVIFDSAGGNWSGEVCNIIVGVVQLVVSIIAAIVMDKFQRKHIMIISASFQAISMALLSLYLILKDKGVDVEAFGWAPLLCFLGYVSFYNIGVGPLWKTVLGEILPQGIKNTAMSFCSLWYGGIVFMLTFTFQRIEQSIGLGETLIFFSIISLSTAVYVAIFIVETKGKTLAEIQLELNAESDICTFALRKNHFVTKQELTTNLFSVDTRPECLKVLYSAASKTPVAVMRQLDRWRRDGHRSSRFFMCTPVLGQRRKRIKCNGDIEIETRVPAAVEELRRWTSTEALGDITVTPDCPNRIPPNVSQCTADGDDLTDGTALSDDEGLDHKLPSPEEQVQVVALKFPSEMVTVDISGRPFDRMSLQRRSLMNGEIPTRDGDADKKKTKTRRPRSKRRSTLAGTDQKEIQSAVTAGTSQPTSSSAQESIAPPIKTVGRSKSSDILRSSSKKESPETKRSHFNTLKQWSKNRYDRLMNRSNEDKYKDKDIDEFNLYETVTMKRRRNVDKKLSLHQRSSSVSSSEKSSVNLPISSTLSGVMNIAVRLRESSLQRRERRKGRNKDEPHSSSGNWSASSESGRNSLGSEITSSTIQPKSTTSTATSNNSLNLPVPGSICGRRRFVNASASSSVTSEGTLTPDIIHDLHEDGETSSVYSCDTEGYYTSFHMDSGLKTLKEEELPPTPLHISNTLDFPSNSAENEYELFGKGSTSTTTSSAGTICTTLRASESNRSLIIGPAVPERKSSLNSKYPDGSLERDESSEKTGTVKRSPATTKAIINAEDKRSDGGISPDSGHNTSSSPIESTNSPNGVRSGSEFEFSESSDMEGPERIERIRVKTTINSSRIPSMCVITPSPSDDESSQSSRNSNRNEEPRDRNFENGKNRISGTNKFISVDQNTGYATLETIQTKPTEKCTDINRNAASITTNNSVRAPSPSGGTVIIRDEVPIPKTNQPIFKSTLLPFNNMFDKIKTNLSNLKHRKEDKSPNRNQSSDNKECDNGEYVTIADVRNNNNKTVGNDENSYVNDIVNKNLKTILSGKIKETEYVSLNELPCNETNIENPLSNIDSLERKKRQGARVTLDAEGKVVYTSDSLKRKKGLQTTFEPGPFVKTTSPKPSPLPSHRIPKNVRAVTQTDRGLPDGSVPVPSQLGKVIIKASSDASHEIIRMPPATIVGPNKRPMSPKLSGRGAYVHVQDAGKPQEKERVPLSPERQMYQSVPEFGQPVDMSRYQRVLYDQNPTHVYHDQYYLGRGTQYQTLPTKKTQLYYGDIQPERSVTPDITRGLERHEDLHMDYPGFEKVGLQSFYNESRIYADNTHRDDALLNQKLGIPIAIPQLHNFNDSNPSSSIIHPNNSLVQTNQLNPSISPMKEQLNRTDQVDYSFKISPIDPRSAGCFQSSTPSQIPPLKGAVNLESKIMSPKKSTMSNEELYAVIHKSKKRMNIKTEEENRSPVRTFDNNTQIEKVKTPESGYLGDRVRTRLSWSPNTQNECDIRELHVDSVPTESRSRQSWAYNDRKKVPQTSRLDFKKLLLQKSSNLLSNTKKPSAVEQLKLSKEQIQQRPFSPPVQPPGMNILELSGSPRSLVNRRFANPSSSPKHTVDKIKPAKLMSPRSQWRFASPRSDVLSSTILEDCREDETNSSGEKKPSPVRLETKFDDQGTTSSTNPVKYNTEPRRRYATIAERMQAQRAEFFNTGSSSSNQFTNNQTPKEKSKIPALETSF